MLLEFKINVNEKEVLKQLHDENANEKVKQIIRKALKESQKLIDAKAVVKEVAISKKGKNFVEENSISKKGVAKELATSKKEKDLFATSKKEKDFVELENTNLRIESKNVAFLLKDCAKVTLFACTVSSDFRVNGEPLKELIFDAIGSVAVEKLAGKVNEIVRKKAKEEGFKITRRYSCGFADWKLSDQGKILKALNAGEIGLRVNEANILIPRKSVTAIIGWFK